MYNSVPKWLIPALGGRYVCRNSQRILVEAAYNGVIRREESSLRRIPHSSLPVPKFAANVVPCSAPLMSSDFPD